MIWLAIIAAGFLALAWCACILAGRAHARDHAADDSCEWLGVGSDHFLHEGLNK